LPRISGPRFSLPAIAGLALAVSACSGDWNLPKFEVRSLELNPTPPSLRPLGPVTPDQLVGADGSCASAGDAAGAGIALTMTECEVVSRAGTPENVEISANERGERSVVLTYIRGPRPGIYRFIGGRLTVIDRASEPAAPPKAVKTKKKAAKKKTPNP
jgi:hypothetical protein